MKKVLLFSITILLSFSCLAQVNIGRSVQPTNLYIRNIEDSHFDALENSTTHFIVPASLDFETTKQIITDVWTYNSIVFIPSENYVEDDLMIKGNTVIRIHDTGYSMEREHNGQTRTVGTWFAYKFELIHYENVTVNKKGKIKPETLELADVIFTPSMRYRYEMQPGYEKKKAENIKDEPDIYNFQLGFIKNYFQILNRTLTERRTLDLEKKFSDKSKLILLKDQVLFAPDWILKQVHPFTGQMTKILEPDDIFKTYDFSYKLISAEKINDKILNGEAFYYLMHTQFNEHQILSIINSVNGEILYSAEKKSYNISSWDLKALNKAISK